MSVTPVMGARMTGMPICTGPMEMGSSLRISLPEKQARHSCKAAGEQGKAGLWGSGDREKTKYCADCSRRPWRSEEHTSELQSLMRISYAVFCLKKKKKKKP